MEKTNWDMLMDEISDFDRKHVSGYDEVLIGRDVGKPRLKIERYYLSVDGELEKFINSIRRGSPETLWGYKGRKRFKLKTADYYSRCNAIIRKYIKKAEADAANE